MGFRSRLRSDFIEMAATVRMLKHAREFSNYNAARYLHERATREPNNVGLLFEDQRYTWREINAQVNRYARFFQAKGVGQGQVVSLFMDNRPEFLFIVGALSRLRAVSALINTNITGAGLTHAINVGEPKLVICGSEHLETLDAVADSLCVSKDALHVLAEQGGSCGAYSGMNDALAEFSDAPLENVTHGLAAEKMCYIYTSGTTGLPKAAIITNKRWVAAAYLFGASMMDASPRDCIYVALPLYHSSAMFAGFGSSVVTGATLALRRRFSASNFWEDARKFDASIFLYIGELCRYLLNTPAQSGERTHRLRLGVGNGLRPDIWEKFQERFGIPLVREFYGATEGNAPIVNVEGRPGMIGRLRPGQVLVRCDESTGEITRNASGTCDRISEGEKGILLGKINRLMTFDGYVDKKATSKKVVENVFKNGDQYFNSGDLIQLHRDGWVSFADRVGDTFRWKGENVSTNEVAEILNGCDGVLEANVYGVTVTGADGRAGMSSINCDEAFSLESFAKYVNSNLASFQRPLFVRLQKGMRVTATLKHQKVDYRNEGYDPGAVKDPLYFLDGDQYQPIDDDVYAKLSSGELAPR